MYLNSDRAAAEVVKEVAQSKQRLRSRPVVRHCESVSVEAQVELSSPNVDEDVGDTEDANCRGGRWRMREQFTNT